MALFGVLGASIVPDPETMAQRPVPFNGATAFKAVLSLQRLWSDPAFAGSGAGLTVMLIWSLLVGQLPLLIVHSNTVVPGVLVVNVALAAVLLLRLPLPETTDQAPVPTEGLLA